MFWGFVGNLSSRWEIRLTINSTASNRGVGFVGGLGFPVGGIWWGVGGVLALSRLTASNCGKGLPKVL